MSLSEYYFWVSLFEKSNVFVSKMVYVCFIGRFDSRTKQQDALRHFRTLCSKIIFVFLFFFQKLDVVFEKHFEKTHRHKNTAHTEPGGEPRFLGWFVFFCPRFSRKTCGWCRFLHRSSPYLLYFLRVVVLSASSSFVGGAVPSSFGWWCPCSFCSFLFFSFFFFWKN